MFCLPLPPLLCVRASPPGTPPPRLHGSALLCPLLPGPGPMGPGDVRELRPGALDGGKGLGAVLPPGGLHPESLMWGLYPGHAGDGGKGRGLATGSQTSGPGKRGGSGGLGRAWPGAKVSWRCGAGAGKGLWDGEGLMGEIWGSL